MYTIWCISHIFDALRDLVPFVQFNKLLKHPWKSVTFSKVVACNFIKNNTPLWVFFCIFKVVKMVTVCTKCLILNKCTEAQEQLVIFAWSSK